MYYQLAKLGRYIEKTQVKLMMKYGLKPYQPDPFDLFNNVTTDRDTKGTIDKWVLIEEHLPKEAYTALDIGCNIGYYSFKMAQGGADHVLGIDIERGPLLIAEKLKLLGRVGNVGFCTLAIEQKNVGLLGQYDVILFLSVFHHLVYTYGMDSAKDILQKLIGKTRKVLFFETGQGDQDFGEMAGAMPKINKDEAEKYFTDLLLDCGAARVERLGETALKNDVTRLLFKVEPPQTNFD